MTAARSLAKWLLTALAQMVTPHARRTPRDYCEPCGVRRPVAHVDGEHGTSGRYWE